ncbi:MAG: hypothetical protein J1F64_06530 [Oscillospiraceae bacterium]|nr:hypothetical protein [Oscillospiraceae bacterium]
MDGYILCVKDGGYYKLDHTCAVFKYDIFKKQIRRKKEFSTSFTAEDFKL